MPNVTLFIDALRSGGWLPGVAVIAAVAALFIASLRPPRPAVAALLGAVVTAASALAASSSSPFVRMCGAIVPALFAFKLFVFARRRPALSRAAHVAFFMWPDMDVRPFLRRGAPQINLRLIRVGLIGFVTGAISLVFAYALHVHHEHPAAVYVLALFGGSLSLHFGVLRLGAAGLAAVGFSVPPLFTSPLGAVSLRAFWGGKWNAAFANLMRELFVEPLGRDRKAWATWLAFVASAGLHEMAITWPLDAGYGGPSLYFIIQAVGHRIESALPSRRWGRVMTLVWLALPLPLLFPVGFVSEILLVVPRVIGDGFVL